jgi:hypothetical protein
MYSIARITNWFQSQATKTEVKSAGPAPIESADVLITSSNKITQLFRVDRVQMFILVPCMIYLLALAIPVYSLGVYPYLPQRIGGGGIIAVQVVTPLKMLCKQFADPSMRTYLVDRTSSSLIFQLVKEQESQLKENVIMEVANSQIQSIVYKADDKARLNDCVTGSDQKG